MNGTTTIYVDTPLDARLVEELCEGVAPHRILRPAVERESVLAAPAADVAFGEAEVAFGQPAVEDVARSERLCWLHVNTAGFTRYDTPEFREMARQKGLVVTNSSSVYASACAEHAVAFLLGAARRLPDALASRAANGSMDWKRLRAESRTMAGQKVVLLGYGGIARELVKRLAGFDMEMVAIRRRPTGDEAVRTVPPDHLAGELADADHVMNLLPDNAESRGSVDIEMFSAMKPGVVFHNIGRGTTVDQGALLDALRSGHVAEAWLDVTDPEPLPDDHPLRAEPRCFITPHIAGGHGDESRALLRHFLSNFRRFMSGAPLVDRVM
ncbi:MAG: D-2-hydroxyacid dehydrogenase [Akkermansiaceae bacterium]|nr:D-2-hydroxyacid dehydrogenase [Akkermansiaceae bacterium]MCP5545095.1 D-2-hydroxyacid dehydrogenase [Akkermansiaceae bacterium]